jgi:hypothetical protein
MGVVKNRHEDEKGQSVVVSKTAGQGEGGVMHFSQDHCREVQDEGSSGGDVPTDGLVAEVCGDG